MLNPLALIRVTLQRGNQQVAELYMGKRAIMKASLLAGVGFALAMNRGQTGYSAPDVSGWTGFAAPAFRLINQVEHYPLPCGLKPRCVHLTGYVGHFRVYFRLRHLECDRGEERKGERERGRAMAAEKEIEHINAVTQIPLHPRERSRILCRFFHSLDMPWLRKQLLTSLATVVQSYFSSETKTGKAGGWLRPLEVSLCES